MRAPSANGDDDIVENMDTQVQGDFWPKVFVFSAAVAILIFLGFSVLPYLIP